MTRILTAALFLAPLALRGAERDPQIGYLYPAGGRQGTSFEVVVGGCNLNEISAAEFSGNGVHATILKEERQVTPDEQKALVEAVSKLQEKRRQGLDMSPEEERKFREMTDQLTKFGRRLANPSLGEFVTMRVTIDPAAPLGEREVRLVARPGMSNPRTFCIGEFPEVAKPDWKNIPKSRDNMDAAIEARPPDVRVSLPVTANGQIPPGGADRYVFTARKGQQIVVDVRARSLIPFIADAVPGWLQATARLLDAKDKELAYVDDFRLRPDPLLFYQIPAGGDYVLEIHDALYRGREDFVYRVTIGEIPFVTGIFPLGCREGTTCNVALDGWNLPDKRFRFEANNATPGVTWLAVSPGANRVPFTVDTLAECVEKEPNDLPSAAQAVAFPMVINGRIDEPGDWDIFRFEGKAGQEVVAAVTARTLDSPLDSLVILLDGTGQRLTFNDDQQNKSEGITPHQADSHLTTKLPADGSYLICIGDTQHAGGSEYSYRLRISSPQPDFELRFTPSAINIRGGGNAAVNIFALRKDGFNGPIELRLRAEEAGFRLSGASIPAGSGRITATLSAPAQNFEAPLDIGINGMAVVDGEEVIRPALPADDMTQAFAYHHLVPAQRSRVLVGGRFRAGDQTVAIVHGTLVLAPGTTAAIPVRVPAGPQIGTLTFELLDPPPGVRIRSASRGEIVLECEAGGARPGQQGNLIVAIFGELAPDGNTPPGRRRVPLGTLPAIPYQISR